MVRHLQHWGPVLQKGMVLPQARISRESLQPQETDPGQTYTASSTSTSTTSNHSRKQTEQPQASHGPIAPATGLTHRPPSSSDPTIYPIRPTTSGINQRPHYHMEIRRHHWRMSPQPQKAPRLTGPSYYLYRSGLTTFTAYCFIL